MEENTKPLQQAKQDAESYLQLKLDQVKLLSVDKLSSFCNSMLVTFLIIFLLAIVVGFLACALALWIGDRVGSLAMGAVIAAVAVAVIAVVVIITRRRLLINAMTKLFIRLFFSDNGKTN